MFAVSGIRSIAKGITRAFGSSAVHAPQVAKGTSIFADAAMGAAKISQKPDNITKTTSIFTSIKNIYIRLKNVQKLGLQKAEVAELEKLEGLDFFSRARDILAQKIGIPNELMPPVYFLPNLPNPRQCACFNSATHSISMSLKQIEKNSKSACFSLLAHEMQHCEQTITILRSKAAPEAINYYSGVYARDVAETAITNYKNLPLEHFEKLVEEKKIIPEALEYAKKIKKASPSELEKMRGQLENAEASAYSDFLKKIRQIAIEKLGILPEKYDGMAKDYLKGLIQSGRSESKGFSYYFSIAEIEAYIRQGCASREYKSLMKK